ncbi:MAG: hypothetical protein Q8L04_12765 [Ignavibacteria bacterium]|nr:hypothetical protein [Ignavibacteria bacterium]
MPFKKSTSGNFSEYFLSHLNMQMRGILLLKNERNEIIMMRASEDAITELKALYNSNDYCWRYNPKKFEIENVYFKDLNTRYRQLLQEIPTLMQADIDLVSDW